MSSSCPSDAELKAFLTLGPGTPTPAGLEAHLDACPICRQRLDRWLADGVSTEATDLRSLAGTSPPSPALARLLESLSLEPESVSIDWLAVRSRFEPSESPGSLGRWAGLEVREVVAAGGMGIVFKARDPELDRWVALKILAPALATSLAARQRFLREARAAAAVRHENVTAIYSVGEAADLPYLAMEFIHGESLAQRLQRTGPLETTQLLLLARQVTQGLVAAHAAGLIHRDLKPGNVLIEAASGRYVLTDFGLARAVDDTALTRSGTIVGTPEFLSPEQAAGQPLDARSDLFSLGALLYAAATGHSPFHAPTTLAVLRRVGEHTPPPVQELQPKVPLWFGALLETLLAKAPSDRFASATDFLAALDAGERGEPSRPSPSATRRRAQRRRFSLLLATGVALVAVLLVRSRTTAPPKIPAPFRLYATPTGPALDFNDLPAALEAAPAQATIELAWNGPRILPPLVLPPRPLTLRAAPGFRPIWTHIRDSRPGLTATADLTLIGLEWITQPSTNAPTVGRETGPWPSTNWVSGWWGSEAIEFPTEESALRCSGAALVLRHCRLLVLAHKPRADDGFIAINLDRATECRLEDSALLMGAGKAFVCRGPGFERQLSVVISNSVVTASQLWWINTRGRFELVQSTVQGGALVFLSGRMEQVCRVEARSNLLHTGFAVVDQRREGPRLLPQNLSWTDRGNLYALTSQPRGEWGYVRFAFAPRLGPPRLRAWLNDFLSVDANGSFEGAVTFTPLATHSTTTTVPPPPEEAFRVLRIDPDFADAPLPTTLQGSAIGANLDSVGPETLARVASAKP